MPAGKHIKKQGIHSTTYLTVRRKNPSEAKFKSVVQTHVNYIDL